MEPRALRGLPINLLMHHHTILLVHHHTILLVHHHTTNMQSSVSLAQAIKVRTSPGTVETALMLIVELEASATDLRTAAIYHRNPLHTFMFNSNGDLLTANEAALAVFQGSPTGHCPSTLE